MEFFQRAKVFRLKCSSQTKYLIAHKDEETVKQSRDNSSNNARWSYELVEGKPNIIRIRSCCTWRYLAAIEDPFLFGMTGKKVVQTIRQGSIIEWEPIKEGSYIRLKSHTGSTLRANRGPPPWRNSVTHDEPGNWTGTDHMAMWIVDIVVIDYQSSTMDDGYSTTTKEDKRTDAASLSCKVADQEVVMSPACYPPKGNSNIGPNGSPANVCSSTEHSDSLNKLKSMLASLDDELNVPKMNGTASEDTVQSTSKRVQPLEVMKAKETIEQLISSDFDTILSLGQYKKLEKAVDVLIANAKSLGRGNTPSKLISIQEQLKSMKNDHESASQALANFSAYSARRSEARNELKKDAAKARELENFEAEINNRLLHARAKREELLNQLEETENNIEDVERAQSDNMAQVDELIAKIQQKSWMLKEMENQEKSWRMKKNEAESMLERVEKDWGIAKNIFAEL